MPSTPRTALGAALAALALAAPGCAPTRDAPAPAPRATPVVSVPGTVTHELPGHRYSPFAIRLDGHAAFDVVTFKDVSATLPDPALQIDELMAEAFALALRNTRPTLMTEVVHEPGLLDPGNHVFCDRRHLYVDFWQSPGAAAGLDGKWGYSLWSGCGEDDRFAWQEVDASAAAELGAQIEHVVRGITRSLHVADGAQCHRRDC